MKTIEGNYVMCSSAGKICCKDCGYFHLTHMATTSIPETMSGKMFFTETTKEDRNAFVRKERFYGISRFNHFDRCCNLNYSFQ